MEKLEQSGVNFSSAVFILMAGMLEMFRLLPNKAIIKQKLI